MSKMSLSVQKLAASQPDELQILPLARARLNDLSLELPEDTTYEEWARLGHAFDRADRSLRWWIGDWWNFGERAYGDPVDVVQIQNEEQGIATQQRA